LPVKPYRCHATIDRASTAQCVACPDVAEPAAPNTALRRLARERNARGPPRLPCPPRRTEPRIAALSVNRAMPRHARIDLTCAAAPCAILPRRATAGRHLRCGCCTVPAMPRSTRPNRAQLLPHLPRQTVPSVTPPDRAEWRRAIPAVPSPARSTPCPDAPNLPGLNIRHRTEPRAESPYRSCHTVPSSAEPVDDKRNHVLACQT